MVLILFMVSDLCFKPLTTWVTKVSSRQAYSFTPFLRRVFLGQAKQSFFSQKSVEIISAEQAAYSCVLVQSVVQVNQYNP